MNTNGVKLTEQDVQAMEEIRQALHKVLDALAVHAEIVTEENEYDLLEA